MKDQITWGPKKLERCSMIDHLRNLLLYEKMNLFHKVIHCSGNSSREWLLMNNIQSFGYSNNWNVT